MMENSSQPASGTPSGTWTLGARLYEWISHRILHTDDRPHRLALGFAIGVFVAFTPTIGLQTPICLALAWLMSANRVVGLPLVWISNPATFIPIYYPCYRLGCRLTGFSAVGPDWFSATFGSEFESTSDQLGLLGAGFLEIVLPLWMGCLVVASVAGSITYFVMLAFIRHRRARHSTA